MTNPARYLVFEDQKKTIKSIKDVRGDGSFYTMDCLSDHRLEEILTAGPGTMDEFMAALQKYLVADRLKKPTVGAGCAAFKAVDKKGHVLVGRNFDFKHVPSTMLIRTKPETGYKAFGMCDLVFAGFEKGQLTDGKTDITNAVAFPYVTMDGINEKGLFICCLQLRKAETRQNTGKTKLLSTVALRAALDKTENVQGVVDLFGSYDMQTSMDGNDFHFFVADADGDSIVIEYLRNQMNVIKTDHVTNFFLSPGARRKGGGKLRYDVMGDILDYRNGILEKSDAMDVLRFISQPSGDKGTSYTLWSAVYDLTEGSVDLAIDQKYGDVLHYSLK